LTSQTPSTGFEIYRFVVRPKPGRDARAASLIADAQALGLQEVSGLECQDLYFIEGRLSGTALGQIAAELLSDPITQTAQWRRFTSGPAESETLGGSPQAVIEVALRPGVTDPVAEQIVRAARQLGIDGVRRASTGQRYLVSGEGMDPVELHLLARRLLANPVIQRYAIGEIEPVFPHPAESSGQVDLLPLRQLADDQLLPLSQERRAALDLKEMQAIQAYYSREGRDPTDVEFEMIAQTWSEHCVHKTFKARIEVSYPDSHPASSPQVIDGLLKTYLRAATEQIAAPWVRSAFVDNAGILEFDGEHEISFKVETHNHPSAIEPFGGANTGTGGVIRDVLGVSARPIAATDILCFGPQDLPLEELPEGVLHPRRIQSGVVAGIQDYGNKIGIPTVNGAILYDPGYIANPLVFCGCVGIAPRDSHPRQPASGDRVIVLGGRTGRDGLRGATFSSMTMDAQTGEVAGASVQIGDPITEKGLIEVIVRARDRKLYSAITDCGAGGLSSAVGEMSRECGARVELKDVRLKYPGLAPWEIWLSEAQERMVLAVPEANLLALKDLCNLFEVELTDIGTFNDSGRLVVQYAGKTVLDLENHFLHEGLPQRRLLAVVKPAVLGKGETNSSTTEVITTVASGDRKSEVPEPDQILLSLLAHPDIRSKSEVIRIYDHEIQGGTVVKPLVGVQADAPSDAVVLKPAGARGNAGVVLSNGINPAYGKVDPYRMAWSVIDEAVRNAVAVGADPERIALLDNFCWGDPTRPETLGALVEAARGCHDAALYYQAPFISGKDSLNNEYLGADGLRHAIPPTLLISAIGVIQDVSQTVTMDLKQAGNSIYVLGVFPTNQAGDPHFRLQPEISPELEVPPVPEFAMELYRALHRAVQRDLVRACHDLSEGGLAVAAAEMCIGGRLGMDLVLDAENSHTFFRETNAALLVEVRTQDELAFESCFAGLPVSAIQRAGKVTAEPVLRITNRKGIDTIELPVSALAEAWGAQ
jgi:phosphoribosylformylglycinamidine synthase subunit PurSL